MHDILSLLSEPFMVRALLASAFAALVSAVMGSFVVLRGLSTIGAAIAHASLAGALLAYAFGLDPSLGALLLSLSFAAAAAYSGEKRPGRMDVMLGVVFGFSASIAALALSMTREYATAAYAYLVGDVLGVTWSELWTLASLAVSAVSIVILFYKELCFVTFDHEAAEAMGVNVRLYHYLVTLLVAVTAVVELRVVGSILAVVLLVAPAAAALELVHSLKAAIVLSAAIALASSLLGVVVAVVLGIPTSPAIGLISSVAYLISLAASPKRRCCR